MKPPRPGLYRVKHAGAWHVARYDKHWSIGGAYVPDDGVTEIDREIIEVQWTNDPMDGSWVGS
jgi:hypothetical protein